MRGREACSDLPELTAFHPPAFPESCEYWPAGRYWSEMLGTCFQSSAATSLHSPMCQAGACNQSKRAFEEGQTQFSKLGLSVSNVPTWMVGYLGYNPRDNKDNATFKGTYKWVVTERLPRAG